MTEFITLLQKTANDDDYRLSVIMLLETIRRPNTSSYSTEDGIQVTLRIFLFFRA